MAQRKGKQGESASTIVIRREEIIEDGHHGGAWKVAYADFVTAMMAFFLLMWLINAVTEDQRRGIAAYFNPLADTQHSVAGAGLLPSQPTPFSGDASVTEQIDPKQAKAPAPPTPGQPTSPAAVSSGAPASAAPAPLEIKDSQSDPSVLDHAGAVGSQSGGQSEGADGTAAGRAVGDEGGGAGARTHEGAGGAPVVQAVLLSGPATGAARERVQTVAAAGAGDGVAPAVHQVADALREMLRDDPAVSDSAGQVDVAATPEGLRVQIMDASKQPMFDTGSATPNPRATALLRRIAPYLAKLGGPVSIDGYTDAALYVAGRVSNWTLSSARADAAEELLVASGLPEERIASVSGHAGRELLFPAEPLAAANRRIVMVVRRPARAEISSNPDR